MARTLGGHPSLAGMNRRQRAPAGTHLAVSLLAAAVAAGATAAVSSWRIAGLVAWIVAASVFLTWTWTSIWPLDAPGTALLAQREDPSRVIRDIVLLAASVGALLAVALVIFRARHAFPEATVLGVACIAASSAVLHTTLTLRYARLYYTEPLGGLDFNQDADPAYRDFAYVAFTVGMTFQVSDTDVQKTTIRATILQHALVSFVLGAVIIAVTINIVAGLSR